MRVAFCAIVYEKPGERPQTEALIASAEKAGFTDWVIAVDEKGDPTTLAWLKERLPNGDVFPFVMELVDGVEDFSRARNLALARVPKDMDWWGWADRDDTIEMLSGRTIPEILSVLPEKDSRGLPIGAVFFEYDYAQDEYANSTTSHIKGRLYRNSLKWEWRNRVHEDCYPLDGDFGIGTAVTINEEDLRWVHHIEDRPSSYERNMRILKKMLEDKPDEPRTWYYLGNQHFAQHEFRQAAEAYETYVGMSGWDQEKWTALIYQGISYQQLKKYDDAISSYARAMLIRPDLADAYFGIGEVHARLGQWEKGRYWGEEGIKKVAAGGLPDKTVFFNANAYQFNPYLWLATCYWNLGESDLTLSAYEQAAKARPEPDLLWKIEYLKWALARQRIIENGIDLAAGLLRRNEPLKAKAVLENLPAGTRDDINVRAAWEKVNERLVHLDDPVAYKNLYFLEEEALDPFQSDEHIQANVPRMHWVLRRLNAAGAKRVLDVGIGDGTQAFYLARHGISVVGIDVDWRRVQSANKNAVKAGYMKEKTVEFDEDESVVVPDMDPNSPVSFHFSQPGEVSQKVRDMGPFDAVIATELIEHVPDPQALLKLLESVAPRVLLTTPEGDYDGPQDPNPGHVRAWSQREFTRLILPRKITELHTIRDKSENIHQGNIVCEYEQAAYAEGDRVTIFCGNTGQGWSPDSIWDGGIGGSETAVIRVAEELAKRGRRVTVYAECEGVWNNVRYALAEDFVAQPRELYVAWRSLAHVQRMKSLAQNVWIWSHDVHFGQATEEQLKGTKVIALSRWHRDFLQRLYPTAQILIMGNGIDPERFDQEVPRQKHRLIYASSPDRGLNVVLRSWPKIKAKFPDAELSVFYGFDMARQRNPEFIASVEEMAQQDGVTLHGRVDQMRLAEEYLRSDVLLYPAQMPDGEPFAETYWISGVEAQAAGCVPITPSHGALYETNSEGIQTDDLLGALAGFWSLSEKKQNARRERCKKWARQQTWSSVVDMWVAASSRVAVAA